MNIRVACLQTRHAESIEATLAGVRPLAEKAARAGARVLLLPEYFFVPDSGERPKLPPTQHALPVRAFLAEVSNDLRLTVVSNVLEERPEGTVNVGVAYAEGRLAGEQVKIHPMPGEEAWKILKGDRLHPFPIEGIPAGLLVCADILYPEASRILSLKGAELLLNPVMSPFHEIDPTKEARAALYIARAYDAGAFVMKSGGFAPTTRRAVGRSLIAAPWGILAHAASEWEEDVLVADLDFATLRAFRSTHRGLAARSPHAYRDLLA